MNQTFDTWFEGAPVPSSGSSPVTIWFEDTPVEIGDSSLATADTSSAGQSSSASGEISFTGTVATTSSGESSSTAGGERIMADVDTASSGESSGASGILALSGSVETTEGLETSDSVGELEISGTVETTETGSTANSLAQTNYTGDVETASAGNASVVSGAATVGPDTDTIHTTVTAVKGLIIHDSPHLVGLYSLELVTVTDGVQFYNNPALWHVRLPVYVLTNGADQILTDNDLDETSVNDFLARAVASPLYVSGTINMQGGTNAPPSGQGLVDAATLIGRGVIVLTN